MNRIIVGAFVISAGIFAGCQDRSVSDRQAEQEDVAGAREELGQTKQEAQQEVAETQQQAQQDVAEERAQAGEEVAEARQDLTKEQREAAEKAGQPVSVTGEVTSLDKDSFDLKTADGDTLSFEAGQNASQLQTLKEGAQVRASYSMQNEERTIQNIEVLQPAAPEKDDGMMERDTDSKY